MITIAIDEILSVFVMKSWGLRRYFNHFWNILDQITNILIFITLNMNYQNNLITSDSDTQNAFASFTIFTVFLNLISIFRVNKNFRYLILFINLM